MYFKFQLLLLNYKHRLSNLNTDWTSSNDVALNSIVDFIILDFLIT